MIGGKQKTTVKATQAASTNVNVTSNPVVTVTNTSDFSDLKQPLQNLVDAITGVRTDTIMVAREQIQAETSASDRFAYSIDALGSNLGKAAATAGELNLQGEILKTQAQAEISGRQIAGLTFVALGALTLYMVLR